MTPHRQWAASPRRVSSAAAPAARRFDGTPAAPGLLPTAVLSPDRGPGVGRRTKRDQREAVSLSTGLVPRHHPSGPPDPRQAAAPKEGEHRPTTRPSREPCLTGPSLRGGEPAASRMATGLGTNEYRDRPGRCPRHSRPALRGRAAGVRMTVGCGSSAAFGPGAAPATDSKPGRRGRALTTAAVTPEKRRQEERRSPVAVENILS